MKFGRKINTDLYNEWRPFYLDYNLLKRELKARTTGRGWGAELDKIHEFQKSKTTELSQRIRDAEKDVKRLVAEDTEYHDSAGSNGHRRHHNACGDDNYGLDGGVDDEESDFDEDVSSMVAESFDALEERFHGLEEEVANLVADLNITGFMKILKKHDVSSPYAVVMSLLKQCRPPVEGDSSAGGSQSAFVRQTTKYWVHPDNLVPLKLAILRNPAIFNADKEFDPRDSGLSLLYMARSAITSIYFDNEELELYLGRLEKTEGAEPSDCAGMVIRTLKRSLLSADAPGGLEPAKSPSRRRFPIKEHLVNAFPARASTTVDAEVQQLVKKGKKTQQEVDSMIQLANEVQYAVLSRGLKPVMRSFYNRTAFQLPGDARVRISLDTELTMVREDNWDGRTRAGDNWRRTDIGIDFPFEQLPPDDKEIFKYGVLEVKLQTQFGQEPPKWVMDLVQSHLVEALDTDILKPDTGYLAIIERPGQFSPAAGSSTKQSSTTGSSTKHSSEDPTSGSRSPLDEDAVGPQSYNEPQSEGEEDDDHDLLPAKDEDKWARLSGKEVQEAIAYREHMLKARRESDSCRPKRKRDDDPGRVLARGRPPAGKAIPIVKPRTLSIDPLAPSVAWQRISVPVRIEPKVYFAAERTFLKWLNNAVFIGTIATTLLNFTSPEDSRGLISAALFTLAALLAIAYSAAIFVLPRIPATDQEGGGLVLRQVRANAACA
ncbi:VTC domain-containing protein [Mycena olivaceomarginata]|nr:VTC domain-containing protein [Mycena olivaceomarginata]